MYNYTISISTYDNVYHSIDTVNTERIGAILLARMPERHGK